MSDRITVEELSELMKKSAGVTVTPEELQERYESDFGALGIDSLGLLGIVGELENRYGTPMPTDTEKSKSPRQFLELANSALLAGA
ncbi:acyl carrier protein [Streptomyces sp. NBC_00878]|uniref:acyl carrier protein n=1 Tax=Streptomyces sp. NBC_00878 TaxID=2975854 RepID=UPI00224D1A61|nr:acyl carrier protein [Streptomyces sp. NBC_00878]MCX4907419.1 acyl carrier protein [Streptomyces sp. NBC_00878]